MATSKHSTQHTTPSLRQIGIDLSGDLCLIREYLEMAETRSSGDGKTVALLAAAMDRLANAMGLAEQLEGSAA